MFSHSLVESSGGRKHWKLLLKIAGRSDELISLYASSGVSAGVVHITTKATDVAGHSNQRQGAVQSSSL